jgi:hypothetical protein
VLRDPRKLDRFNTEIIRLFSELPYLAITKGEEQLRQYVARISAKQRVPHGQGLARRPDDTHGVCVRECPLFGGKADVTQS